MFSSFLTHTQVLEYSKLLIGRGFLEYDKINKLRGFEVTVVTSAPNDEQGRHLLTLLGMPFRRTETNV